MEPVYDQVANELRSVYHIAYYPKKQDFNGSWRRVKVDVNRKGAAVRTREGYWAK